MSAKNLLNEISNAASKEAIKRLTDDERRLMMSLAIQGDSNQLLCFFKEKGIYNGDIDDRRYYIKSESEYEISNFIKESFNLLGCSREESIELLRGAMRSTPDEKVSVKWKSDFIYEYFKEIYEEFSDLAYDETLPALQSISIVHRVDTKAYLKSTATSITNSDYIMLSLSLLKSLSIEDGSVLETIKKIEIDYFELNYDSAVEKIIELSKSLADAHPKACEAIISSSKTITDITQETNQTRRYFETKFSQYLLGETGKPEIVASIDKISRSLINLGASDPRSAEERIAAIAESGGEDVILRHMQLKQGSEKYATKDRIMREGFLSREEESMEGEVSQEETWSRNLGVMRGTDPNFRDEIAEGNIRNRVPDVNRAREGSSSDYSQRDNRHRSAYTSSISGHTFATVAVLEEYMIRSAEAGESSEELDKDINNFLSAYIGTYAKRGYHSMHEVLDVLREPNIQRVFAKYGVNVNHPIYGESLANAMNDSASYSQRICQKSSMHAEISGMSRTSAANKAQRLLTLNKEKNKLIDAIHNDEKLSEKEREALSRKIEACPSYVALQSMKMGIIQGHLSARKDHDSLGFDNTDILSTDSGFSFKDVYKRNSNSSFWKRFTTDTDKRERQLEGLDSSLKELVDASPETRDAKLKEFYDKVQSTLLEVKGENNFSKSRLGDICEALIYSLEKTNPELCQESPESKRRTSLRD